MKRFFWFVAGLLLTPMSVFALTQSGSPPTFGIPWGNSAGGAYIRSIPQSSQIGIQNCAASLTDGFPALTFTSSSAGGCPPFGQDFNGILKQLSQWSQWQSAGGPIFYNSAFASAAGGYPNGAIISSAVTPGTQWMSTADSNTSNPDTGGANWVQAPGQIPIGTPVQTLSTTIPTGYVSANGKTIGNASSNATSRANADTQFLFAFVWANCTNAACPIFTSTGAGSTRGANAAADFAANKALSVQNMNGLGLMGADSQSGTTSTFLASVPVTAGSATAPGSILGENLHALISAENGPHTHTITDPGHTHTSNVGNYVPSFGGGSFTANGNAQSGATGSSTTGITGTNSSGSGTGHNTVERSTVVYWNLKL